MNDREILLDRLSYRYNKTLRRLVRGKKPASGTRSAIVEKFSAKQSLVKKVQKDQIESLLKLRLIMNGFK